MTNGIGTRRETGGRALQGPAILEAGGRRKRSREPWSVVWRISRGIYRRAAGCTDCFAGARACARAHNVLHNVLLLPARSAMKTPTLDVQTEIE